MLNKEVCKKCKEAISDPRCLFGGWHAHDDLLWLKGYILCPYEYQDKDKEVEILITGSFPRLCPYATEQIVSETE